MESEFQGDLRPPLKVADPAATTFIDALDAIRRHPKLMITGNPGTG